MATAFSIPVGSFDFWAERLKSKGVSFTKDVRFESRVITLSDPDGMVLELIEHEEKQATNTPRYSGIEVTYAIQGFYGVTLLERSLELTAQVLELIGIVKIAEEGNLVRFAPRSLCTRGRGARPIHRREGRYGCAAGHHGCGKRASYCVPQCGRCSTGRMATDALSISERHSGAGPDLLPLHLLP